MTSWSSRAFGALASLAVMLAVVTAPVTAHGADFALVRAAHFSPDTPGVDVYLDGKRAVGNMGFKTVTDYLQVPGGAHDLALRPSGASASSPPVLSGKATFDDGKAYTIAGLGPRAQLHVGVFTDSMQPPPAGEAEVRVLHAVVGTAAVDASLGAGDTIDDVQFGTPTDYQSVSPGTHMFSLTTADGKSVLAPTQLQIGAGITYTIAAIGGGTDPVRVLPIVDERAASSAPAGGLATGEGGTAVRPHSHVPVAVYALVAASGLVCAFLVRRRARRVV